MDNTKILKFSEDNPMSICSCGHTGDGGNSQHARGGFQQGHGACNEAGCNCKQFTWVKWTDEAQSILKPQGVK